MEKITPNNVRLRYEITGPGCLTLEIRIWEEDHVLHYSWYYAFSNDRNQNCCENMESSVSVDSLKREIEKVKGWTEIKPSERVFDPAFYQLEIRSLEENIINLTWSDDDRISSELKDFISFIGYIVGEAPFTPM